MSTTIDSLVEDLERPYRETQERMSDPAVYNDRREAAQIGRRLKQLEEPHRLAEEWRQARADLDAARDDPELGGLIPEYEQEAARLEEELKLALVTADPADAKDAIVEVRSGTGGDEAALWAGDLYRMLTRYAENLGYKVEQLETSPNDGGGYKHVSFAVKGDGTYGVFKWEGGTHRVQRVPETESQGRIHTSAATVAVMPEAEEVEIQIDPNDLKIDVYRSTGPGRSVGEHDRLGRPHHAPPDRPRRLHAGREVAAPEPREGDARAAGPPVRAGARARSAPSWTRRAARRSGRATAPRRSAPTTSRRIASPTTGSG